jgi:hypothetical protein
MEKIALIRVPRRRRWRIMRKRSCVNVEFSELEPRRLRLRFSSSLPLSRKATSW